MGSGNQTTGGQKSYKKWELLYFVHYLVSMFVIVGVLYTLTVSGQANENLRERENVQYLAMTNVQNNTVCKNKGVQFNNILTSLLDGVKNKMMTE